MILSQDMSHKQDIKTPGAQGIQILALEERGFAFFQRKQIFRNSNCADSGTRFSRLSGVSFRDPEGGGIG